MLIPFNAGNDYYTAADTGGAVRQRVIDLGPSVGKTVNGFWPYTQAGGTGVAEMFLSGISIVSTDGTVTPVFNGQAVQDHGPLDSCGGSNDGLVVEQSTTPATTFYVADQVGTAQMEFSATGTPLWKGEFAPFGQELDTVPYYFSNSATNGSANRYRFTGKERDFESGLDYFGARHYSSNLGRFISPDWASKPEAVPYSDLADPQSLNLYGYVRNNPLSKADKDGHDCCDVLPSKEEVSAALASVEAASVAVGHGIAAGAGAAVGAVGLAAQQIFAPQALGDPAETKFLADQRSQGEHHETSPEPQVATGGAGARQGGGKMTDHGQQRADEAKAGDTHRQVGDANKVVSGAKSYTDSDTGHTVHVDGNRVVITNSQGERVTQFTNSRANTQRRIQDGKWVPN